MSTLAKHLGDHPFFCALPEAYLARLATCARETFFPVGAFMFREGEAATEMYLLRKGRIVLEIVVPARGATRVETLGSGDIVGLSWLFPPFRWVADAHVVEDAETIALDATCLRAAIDSDPALGLAVLRNLSQKLYHRLERVRMQRLDVYRGAP